MCQTDAASANAPVKPGCQHRKYSRLIRRIGARHAWQDKSHGVVAIRSRPQRHSGPEKRRMQRVSFAGTFGGKPPILGHPVP